MIKNIFTATFLVTLVTLLSLMFTSTSKPSMNTREVLGFSGAPPDGIAEEDIPKDLSKFYLIKNWVRPDVPVKVALQAGHWKNQEVPEELEKLKNNTGAQGGGKWEWEVNLSVANLTAEILRSNGITVDVLPATVPPEYWADVFLAIHADGNEDPYKSGYKFASPWRDFSGHADELVNYLNKYYPEATDMEFDDNITRNMRGYYAFSWWKYEHSIHPMTTAAIAELGFLTNRGDRYYLIDNPQIPAQALSKAIEEYLKSQSLIQ